MGAVSEAEQLASEHVSRLEELYLRELGEEVERITKLAAETGYHWHTTKAEELQEQFHREWWRVQVMGSDHEEDWVWNSAGRRAFGDAWDGADDQE